MIHLPNEEWHVHTTVGGGAVFLCKHSLQDSALAELALLCPPSLRHPVVGSPRPPTSLDDITIPIAIRYDTITF